MVAVRKRMVYSYSMPERSGSPQHLKPMFNNLIAALAVTAFGLTAMPAKANTSHSYRVGFAGAVMYAATCSYLNGEQTEDQAALKALQIMRKNQIPTSYLTNSEASETSNALYAVKGC
jgi:hypothetical protein